MTFTIVFNCNIFGNLQLPGRVMIKGMAEILLCAEHPLEWIWLTMSLIGVHKLWFVYASSLCIPSVTNRRRSNYASLEKYLFCLCNATLELAKQNYDTRLEKCRIIGNSSSRSWMPAFNLCPCYVLAYNSSRSSPRCVPAPALV